MKIKKSSIIKTKLGNYHRALKNDEFIYFVNYEESDENVSVKMYNRKRELISDNIHAYNSFFDDIETGHYSWISEETKEYINKGLVD